MCSPTTSTSWLELRPTSNPLKKQEDAMTSIHASTTMIRTPIQTLHKTIKVDGLEIFYREAGPKEAPTILLLHGFPTSSHMFRNLIPALADTFHLVAPDY